MSIRSNLILFVVTLLLGVYILLFEIKSPDPDLLEAYKKRISLTKSKDIIEILFKKGDLEILLAKEQGQWQLKSPLKDLANQALIKTSLELLEEENYLEKIVPVQQPGDVSISAYGLKPPHFSIKITTMGDESSHFHFGNKEQLTDNVFLQKGDLTVQNNLREILVVDGRFAKSLDWSLTKLRAKKLLGLPIEQFTSLWLQKKDGSFFKLEKKGESWQIFDNHHHLLPNRADRHKVTRFLAKLNNLQINRFLTPELPREEKPEYTIGFLAGKSLETISFFQVKDKLLARRQNGKELLEIEESLERMLSLSLEYFYDPWLFDFSIKELGALEFHHQNNNFRLENQKGSWRFAIHDTKIGNRTSADNTAGNNLLKVDDELVANLLEALKMIALTRETKAAAPAYCPSLPHADRKSISIYNQDGKLKEKVTLISECDGKMTAVQREGDKAILLAEKKASRFFKFDKQFFKSRRLFDFSQYDAFDLTIIDPDNQTTPRRNFHKELLEDWRMTSPISALADNKKLDTVLGKIADLRALAFLDPKGDKIPTDQFSSSIFRLTIKTGIEPNISTHIIEFVSLITIKDAQSLCNRFNRSTCFFDLFSEQKIPKNLLLARLSNPNRLILLRGSLLKLLRKSLLSMKICSLKAEEIDQVEIRREDKQILLQKRHTDWKILKPHPQPLAIDVAYKLLAYLTTIKTDQIISLTSETNSPTKKGLGAGIAEGKKILYNVTIHSPDKNCGFQVFAPSGNGEQKNYLPIKAAGQPVVFNLKREKLDLLQAFWQEVLGEE